MATSVAKIQAELDLDSGKFHGTITSAVGQLKSFQAQVDKTDKSIKKIETAVTGFGASLRDSMVILGQFRAAMQTLWMFSGQWVGNIVKANAELEKMGALMRGVAKGTADQRMAQANKDLAYTIELAQKAPFALSELGNAMVKLRSAGLNADKTLKPLTDAVAAFGGDDQTLHRATIALQQMAGKGVVSMEELRQQLGEAVPTAMSLMARGAGVSMGQLAKAVEKGTVEATSAINQMMLEMQREYGGSGERMMQTWNGQVARMKTEWLLFAKRIGDSGLFDAAKKALDDLTNAMRDPQVINNAVQLGKAIGDLITAFGSGVRWILDNQAAIVSWGKAIATIVAAKWILTTANETRLWQNALVSMSGAVAQSTGQTRNLWGAFRGMSVMGQAGVLAKGLTGSLNGVLAALTGFSGPVGLAIGAITLLIGWLAKLNADATRTWQNLHRVLNMKASDFLSEQEYKDATTTLNRYKNALDKVNEARGLTGKADNEIARNRLRAAVQDAAAAVGNKALTDQVLGSNMTWEEKLNAIENFVKPRVRTMRDNINRSIANEENFQRDSWVSSWSKKLDENTQDLRGTFQNREALLESQAEKEKWTQEKLNEERNKLLVAENAAVGAHYDQQIAILTQKGEQLTGEDRRRTDLLIGELKRRKTEVTKLNNDILAGRENGLQLITGPKGAGAGDGKTKANPLMDYYEQIIGKVASLKAKMEDADPTLAKFNALLEAGAYGSNPNSGLVAKIRAAIEAHTDLTQQIKQDKATEKLVEELTQLEAKAASDVVSARVKATGDLYSQVAGGMVGFNRQIAVLETNLDQTKMTRDEFEQWVIKIKTHLAQVDAINFEDYVRNAEWEAYLNSLPPRARALAEFNEQLRQNALLVQGMKDNDPNAGNDASYDALGERLNNTAQTNYETSIKPQWTRMREDWGDITTNLDNLWANSMENMSEGLATMLTGGEFSFKQFAKAVIKELVKIAIQWAIVKAIKSATGYSEGGVHGPDGAINAPTPHAKGGVFGSAGSVPLRKYARGGIAKSPQLALFGEGSKPEAYVPLPDGRTIPVTMEGAGGGGVQNNISITIQMNNDGTSNSNVDKSGVDPQTAERLAKMIEGKAREVLSQEMRQGGSIWRMRNGG